MASPTIRTLRSIVSLASLLTVAFSLVSSASVRSTLLAAFHYRHHPVRLAALLAALILNAKSLPLAWHLRFGYSLSKHVWFQSRSLPKDALFRPVILKGGHTPWMECDYNLHKSNSTYFSDLDIARTELVTCLMAKAIRGPKTESPKAGQTGNTKGTDPADSTPGNYMMALGAVSCSFKKEIKPYENYEIWTRVLSWDRKWIYLISHIVREGTVRPTQWALQPWKDDAKLGRKSRKAVKKGNVVNQSPDGSRICPDKASDQGVDFKRAILATSIAKYVMKKGRLTIPPEDVWEHCGLIPARNKPTSKGTLDQDESQWTWDRVEKERLRGLEIAEKFAALDDLHEEFPVARDANGDQLVVLGEYKQAL